MSDAMNSDADGLLKTMRRMALARSEAALEEELRQCRADLAAAKELNESMIATLPGAYYMDPPDGGCVMPEEQMQRMTKDADRYRWLRAGNRDGVMSFDGYSLKADADLDAAIDAAIAGSKT